MNKLDYFSFGIIMGYKRVKIRNKEVSKFTHLAIQLLE